VAVTVRVVCIPSTDAAFGAYARELLASTHDDAATDIARAQFEHRLRARYPGAIVRSREPFATLGPTTEVVWYATNRTYPHQLAAIVHIAAPPSLVFDVYVDRFPEWQPSLRLRRRPPTSEQPGLLFDAEYELLGRHLQGVFRVVEADAPRSVRVEATGAGGVKVWYATSFRPEGEGTALEVFGDYDVPSTLLPRLQSFVLERIIKRDIARAHEVLKELCEREAAGTAALIEDNAV
jgi:hypothetical protein